MKGRINYWAIVVYYIIAVACRYLAKKAGLLDGINNEYVKAVLTGIGPTIGAVFVFAIFKIRPIMTLKGNYKKILFPIVLYWVLPVVLITAVTYFVKGTVPYVAVFSILIYGLFEEIGWRGFLYQELKGLPIIQNIVIVAILWYIWHLNFELSWTNLSFFVLLILGSWGIGKVADATNSLIAASAFHSLNNFFPHIDAITAAILATLLTVWIISLVVRKKMQTYGSVIPKHS